MAVCPLPEIKREENKWIVIHLLSVRGRAVALFCSSFPNPQGNQQMVWQSRRRFGSVLALVRELGRLHGRVLCLGRLLRHSLLQEEGKKHIELHGTSCTLVRDSTDSWAWLCCSGIRRSGARQGQGADLSFLLNYCLALHLGCFLSEAKE